MSTLMRKAGKRAPSSKGMDARLDINDEEYHALRRNMTGNGSTQLGSSWIVAIILGCGLVAAVCCVLYVNGEFHVKKALVEELHKELVVQKTEMDALNMKNFHTETSLDVAKTKAETLDKELGVTLVKLDASIMTSTTVQHELEEEKVKSNRIMRDNEELHKRLETKIAELTVLDSHTSVMEKEMMRMRTTIREVQGLPAEEVQDSTDYETLYKKQEEMQKRHKRLVGSGLKEEEGEKLVVSRGGKVSSRTSGSSIKPQQLKVASKGYSSSIASGTKPTQVKVSSTGGKNDDEDEAEETKAVDAKYGAEDEVEETVQEVV